MTMRGVLFLLVIAGVSAVLLPHDAVAQSMNIEVSPGKINRIVEPGDRFVQTFRIGNYADVGKTFYIYTQDFTVKSETGAPSFDTSQIDQRYSLSQWVTLPAKEIFVPAGKVRTVDVTIDVPKDAEVGGHYGAFFVQTDDPSFVQKQEGSVIGSIGRIASLMLITVPGDITEKITLTSFDTDRRIYWQSLPDVTFTATLKNAGTVHAIPTGAIFVAGGMAYKGQNVIFNKEQGAVLPGAPARRITETLAMRKTSLLPPMGKFTARFLAKYGVGGGEVSSQATFYVIPIKFLAALFLGILAVLFVIHRAVLSFRRA